MSASVIESFADKRTAAIYKGISVRSLHPDVQKRARPKLMVLDAAENLDDPGSQRGNQLHLLRGSRQGAIQYSRQQSMAHLLLLA